LANPRTPNPASRDQLPHEIFNIDKIKGIILTFAEHFSKVQKVKFDFRKYRNFFYNLNDNEANRDIIENNNSQAYHSILSQFPQLKYLDLDLDTWTRDSIHILIYNFQQIEEIKLRYTILASEIRNIQKDRSTR